MLFPHLHAALVAKLRESPFDGLSADEAFVKLTEHKNLCGLRAISFVSQAKHDALVSRKYAPRILATLVVVDDATLAAFPGGVPGFPNRIGPPENRREWFDAAWMEARG